MQCYTERAEKFAQSLTKTQARLAKPTSNLFRNRSDGGRGLDAASLSNVIQIDLDRNWVDVEAMTPYDLLVKATLADNVLPCVVPQLKSITIGGAVSGIGIESSSFRYGLVHESILELDVALPSGELVLCTPDNEHAALFFGFPNSYGTLGYATRVRAKTIPAKPFVALHHQKHDNFQSFLQSLSDALKGESDFVDGVIFDRDCIVLTTGQFTNNAKDLSDYTFRNIYYRSLLSKKEDYLTVNDYIWRWDTDWFWCSKNLGAQNPLIRHCLGKHRLNSRFYTRVMRWNNRWQALERLERIFGFRRESVIQDVDIPVENAAEFFNFFSKEIGITPIWVCPVRCNAESACRFPLFPMRQGTTYINFGFWDVLRYREKREAGYFNRKIESMVRSLGGIKSLYSTSTYPESEFWATYNGDQYRSLKTKYDPQARLPNLYEKCVLGA